MTFDEWYDISKNVEQKARFEKARLSDCTPVEIVATEQRGVFCGKSYYDTTLTDCSCQDFLLRKMPCKHMYRLSMELKLIEASFESAKISFFVPDKIAFIQNHQFVPTSDVLSDKLFVVSGTFDIHSRIDIADIIEQNGGRLSSSVSAKVDYLVCNEELNPKITKARELGIPIIKLNELLAMLKK